MTLSDADRAAIEARHPVNDGEVDYRYAGTDKFHIFCDTARVLAALSDAEAERDTAQRRADIAETNLRLAVDDLTRERDEVADLEDVLGTLAPGWRRLLPGIEARLALHRERRPAEEGG